MGQQILKELEQKMEDTLNSLSKEFARLRTGRASLGLLEGIRVEYYGNLTPLNQLASLSIPESQLIVIQPWDKSLLPVIEKEILSSDLGLNPANDGKIIRLPIPALTEERRKEIAKLARNMAEQHRITLRNIRREAVMVIKQEEKAKKISEDESFNFQDKIQKITDKFIARNNEISAKKEKEILTC